MSVKIFFIVFTFLFFLMLTAGCVQSAPASTGGQQEVPAPNITMIIPFGPIPVESTNGTNLAYELEFRGMGNLTFKPDKVEVVDAATGTVLYQPGASVLAKTSFAASVPPPTTSEVQNGTGKLTNPRISIWFVVGNGSVPDKLTHRVTLNRSRDGLPPVVVTGGDVVVRKDLMPVVVGSPVKGPGWAVMETTSPVVHHVTSQITVLGVTRVPQRYAQDYLYLDPVTGKAFTGNGTISRDYFGFGKDLYAVANGTVVFVHDGEKDIGITTEKPPMSVATAAGNNIVIDLGNGKYACYAHMVNGSVRVKVGDLVTEGQVIGQMGNTGNSDAPHLHFQVVTGSPSFLGGEGYPIVYRSFNVTGRFDEDTIVGTFLKTPIPQENRLMENDVVVSFP